jgi:energy-coupling factor transport system permease protein
MLHPITWVVWTVAVAAIASMTQNPLYLTILLGIVTLQYLSASKRRAHSQGWDVLLRDALGLALLIVPFNALNAHGGSHVLFSLPDSWPIIGGNITLEAILWGVATALGLLVLVVLFAGFSLQVSQAQVLRLTPAFLYEAGLIVSIALTFIPQMILSAQEIREAQLIRGHRMRRARDTLPLVTALLTTGLERSLQLAESMEARGFGNVKPLPPARDVLYKVLSLLALSGILGGAFAATYLESWRWAGWSMLALCALALIALFWAQGKRLTRTRYRHEAWQWRDAAALAASIILLALIFGVRIADGSLLGYYAYTEIVPNFVPWLGTALLMLLVPDLLQRGDTEPS